MVSGKCPTHPSFGVDLESRLGFAYLWVYGRDEGVVFGKCPSHPSIRVGLESRLVLAYLWVYGRGGWGGVPKILN